MFNYLLAIALIMEVRRIPSTNPDLVEIPEVNREELGKWFVQFMRSIDIKEIVAQKDREIAIVQAKVAKVAKEIEKKALAQKELELQESVFRMHQKLNLDAVTIADVLKLEVKWVEKVLAKK